MEVAKEIIIGVIAIIFFPTLLCFVGISETTRKADAVVMTVDAETMDIYDFGGHHWFRVENNFDYKVGDEVKVKISTNGSSKFSDDKVLSVDGQRTKGQRIEIGYYEYFGDPRRP